MKLTIVSGQSGSGKTIALHALEDEGCYCIDNLPVGLLPTVVESLKNRGHDNIALGIDARSGSDEINRFTRVIGDIRSKGSRVDLLFLLAAEDILLRRYSETRRKHPLTTENISLLEAIREEKEILETIASLSDLTIDTSHLNVHQLSQIIRKKIMVNGQQTDNLSIQVQSFGFKHGVPQDSDFVFDVRSLPNPHWESGLRSHTGLDQSVTNFLESHESVETMFDSIKTFLLQTIPQIQQDNRRYLRISIGCTGGQHRSVYITKRLGDVFNQIKKTTIAVRHRELGID